MFDRPGDVVLDRAENRHVAFGLGIHRCAGSNLARMELRVALDGGSSASRRSASPPIRRSRGRAVKCVARAKCPSSSERPATGCAGLARAPWKTDIRPTIEGPRVGQNVLEISKLDRGAAAGGPAAP